ncbi:membrane protein insertion efficiency factor YidD [Mobilicoccus pelagius]|uniref:Putative membrane protein insertion efficiency factor n=1 Tax=Mobilicoccus pelagius NBRC 104925 TaxID=1089455 RepID=H5USY1_9MICO|nr:membrane protein insertion efficiency factor YidD [Mobilicoccus pelagius]GAB48839.1 hypothetical protein MOPEL_083_00440 [Mobilicoccus pelagius NBRC 104925]
MTEQDTPGRPAARDGHDGQDGRRWVRAPFLAAVRFYQVFISPLTPPSCRFYPSCSAYTFTAIERFGPIRGIWLGGRRLLRCHPWNPGGVDLVPQRGEDGRPVRNNGAADHAEMHTYVRSTPATGSGHEPRTDDTSGH